MHVSAPVAIADQAAHVNHGLDALPHLLLYIPPSRFIPIYGGGYNVPPRGKGHYKWSSPMGEHASSII